VPIAITAYNTKAIEELHVRDLQTLTVAIPNVSLSSINTIPGFANFEIRGFGINGSVPSIEPAVGVFVDGVYQGQTSGIVMDVFDLDSLEVLRGPQGTLFGRNTTGGAVVMKTRRPADHFEVHGTASVESGPLETVGLSVEGPIADNFKAKLAGYVSNDEGYFHNTFDNSQFGKRRISFLRPTVVWSPTADLNTTLILEKGSSSGNGAASTNPINKTVSGFDLDINYPGYANLEWTSATSETNLLVKLGSGVITNVAGWRKLDQDAGEDVDGLPTTGFHARHFLKQEQFSEELRYAGTFDKLDVTAGLFYFQQQYFYIEQRVLATVPQGPVAFGGDIHQNSWAAFTQEEYHVTPNFSLVAGLRYSYEHKEAAVATLVVPKSLCNYDLRTCAFNFPGPAFKEPGQHSWHSVTPRLGFNWKPDDNVLVYGSWSQGVRSGGYNVRSTALTIGPGPYDQERQDAFEVGLKSEWLEHRLRINLAAFHDTIKGLQRDVNDTDPVSGVVQITHNVGDATINGGEFELTALVTNNLTLGLNAGYLDGKYDKLLFDLNGAAPGLGTNLKLARLAPWTYGANLAYVFHLANDATLRARADYGHRDRSAFTDNNAGILSPVDDLSASLAYTPAGGHYTLSAYGHNLLDRVTDGAHAPLPGAVGGGFFVPINKGRVIGAQVTFNF